MATHQSELQGHVWIQGWKLLAIASSYVYWKDAWFWILADHLNCTLHESSVVYCHRYFVHDFHTRVVIKYFES